MGWIRKLFGLDFMSKEDKEKMKTERGITLTILVIYVVFFSIVMGLLAALSNYVYKNI